MLVYQISFTLVTDLVLTDHRKYWQIFVHVIFDIKINEVGPQLNFIAVLVTEVITEIQMEDEVTQTVQPTTDPKTIADELWTTPSGVTVTGGGPSTEGRF